MNDDRPRGEVVVVPRYVVVAELTYTFKNDDGETVQTQTERLTSEPLPTEQEAERTAGKIKQRAEGSTTLARVKDAVGDGSPGPAVDAETEIRLVSVKATPPHAPPDDPTVPVPVNVPPEVADDYRDQTETSLTDLAEALGATVDDVRRTVAYHLANGLSTYKATLRIRREGIIPPFDERDDAPPLYTPPTGDEYPVVEGEP